MTDKLTVHLDEEPSGFLVLTNGIEETKALVRTNLGGEPLQITDLERAVNPSGKGTRWEVPGLGEEPELVSEVEGVILTQHAYRVYYSKTFEQTKGKEPPDCRSYDLIHGEGDPGGECATCPFAQWGSGKTPNSQACSMRRRVFILRKDEMLPMVITLTPVNVRALRNYGVKLMNKKQLELQHVVTKVKMETATSKNGYDYARVIFSLVDVLPPDVAKAMDNYKAFLEPQLMDLEIEEAPPTETATAGEEDVPF